MKKIYHKICPYCSEPFTTEIGYQKFCTKKCGKAEELRKKTGKIKCIKCWMLNKIESGSEERICEECKAETNKKTLNMFSSEELLRYGKMQAERFIKSQKERR